MKITVIGVGKIKEKYFTDAIKEYAKRLSRYCKLEIVEVADEKTPDGASETLNAQIKEKEGVRILQKIPESAYVVALAIDGKMLDSEELATQMVGRQVESIVTKAEDPHGPVVLELKNVRLHKRAQETVSIQVHAGEIFGIAGVDGSGQQELEEMIVGNRKTEEGNYFHERKRSPEPVCKRA